jgi:hypothetical protein
LMGLYVYGRPSKREPPVLRHLDGRHTDSLWRDFHRFNMYCKTRLQDKQ